MPRDFAWPTREDPGCARRDDRAKPFPTRLDHHIRVSSGDNLWAKPDRQRREFPLDFRCSVFAHPGIYQHRGPKVSEQWADLPNVHGDCVVRIERLSNASEVVCTDGVDTLKSGMSFEHCVGESHAAPRRRWYRHVMKHDSVAFTEQTMRYGRPNVPDATNEHPHSMRLHPAHRTATEPQTACVRRQITLSSRPHVCSFIVSEVLSAAGGSGPKGGHPVVTGHLHAPCTRLRTVNRAKSERPTL